MAAPWGEGKYYNAQGPGSRPSSQVLQGEGLESYAAVLQMSPPPAPLSLLISIKGIPFQKRVLMPAFTAHDLLLLPCFPFSTNETLRGEGQEKKDFSNS